MRALSSVGVLVPWTALGLKAAGVLSGRRFRGGNRIACENFLEPAGGGFNRGSVSACAMPDLRDEVLGARGVSIAFIASANDPASAVKLVGVSIPGKLDDRAEKNG